MKQARINFICIQQLTPRNAKPRSIIGLQPSDILSRTSIYVSSRTLHTPHPNNHNHQPPLNSYSILLADNSQSDLHHITKTGKRMRPLINGYLDYLPPSHSLTTSFLPAPFSQQCSRPHLHIHIPSPPISPQTHSPSPLLHFHTSRQIYLEALAVLCDRVIFSHDLARLLLLSLLGRMSV